MTDEEKRGNGQQKTDIAIHDQLCLLVIKDRAPRIDVVHASAKAIPPALAAALALLLVVVVAGNVG